MVSKMMKFQNFGSQTPPKSDVQNFCPLKLVFLGLKFGQNHVFRQFLLYLPPTMIYMVGKPRISASIWHQAIKIWCILQAVRISVTDPDRLLNSSWHCVIRCAELSLVAIVNKLPESWICFRPVLPLMYASQYLPGISKFVFFSLSSSFQRGQAYVLKFCLSFCPPSFQQFQFSPVNQLRNLTFFLTIITKFVSHPFIFLP